MNTKNAMLDGKAMYVRNYPRDMWRFVGWVPDNVKTIRDAVKWYCEAGK